MKQPDSSVRRFLFSVVVRPLMFVLVACVLWGTLLLGTWLFSLARRGFAETWLAARPQDGDLWATANLVLPLVAAAVWATAGAAWLQRRAEAAAARRS
jgi:hypothetical protein